MNKFPEHRYKSNGTKRFDSLTPISFPLAKAGASVTDLALHEVSPMNCGQPQEQTFWLRGILPNHVCKSYYSTFGKQCIGIYDKL